jgi:hypothetical protein
MSSDNKIIEPNKKDFILPLTVYKQIIERTGDKATLAVGTKLNYKNYCERLNDCIKHERLVRRVSKRKSLFDENKLAVDGITEQVLLVFCKLYENSSHFKGRNAYIYIFIFLDVNIYNTLL